MNQEEFINAIKLTVIETTNVSMKELLTDPPGRAPDEKNIIMSKWFNELDESDKAILFDIIRETTEITVFGFLCVLDGVTAIENGKHKGVLKLYHEKDGISVFLNDPNEEYLHNILE